MQEFLQALRERYGDISIGGIFSRNKNFFGEDFNNEPQKNFGGVEILQKKLPDTYGDISTTKIFSRQKNIFYEDFKNEPQKVFYQVEKSAPKNLAVIENSKTEENKNSIINISATKDWIKLRANAADLHDLKNFFAGKTDSQSPLFLNILEQYQKFVTRNLATPADIDEESASDFVSKLADTIKNWFYKILDSTRRGILGQGSEPVKYYEEIKTRIEKYFARIGLKAEKVEPRDNFQKWQEYMTAVEKPTPFQHMHNLISEIIIQPHYFEYYDEDGQPAKSYIEGKCTVFKLRRA